MSARLSTRLLVAGLSLVFTLGLVEVALRLTGVDYSPMRVEDRRRDIGTQHLFDNEAFVYDQVLIWRPRAGQGVFNRQGFRGEEITTARTPGALLLAAVGDSNTLGWGGAKGAHWPGDLERLLRAEDNRHRVVNAGVWGYSSHQGVARLGQVLAFEPDLVTISFGSNDAHAAGVADRAYSGDPTRPPAWKRVAGGLRLGRIALGALAAVGHGRASGSEPIRRVALDDYRANLRRMIAMTREAGARPVLLTRPYLDSVPQPPRWKELAPRYNAATVEVGAAESVPVVDFYSLFKTRDDLFADESHFTADGHSLAAKILLQRLRPLLDREARRPLAD